jgi:hypothetical protein
MRFVRLQLAGEEERQHTRTTVSDASLKPLMKRSLDQTNEQTNVHTDAHTRIPTHTYIYIYIYIYTCRHTIEINAHNTTREHTSPLHSQAYIQQHVKFLVLCDDTLHGFDQVVGFQLFERFGDLGLREARFHLEVTSPNACVQSVHRGEKEDKHVISE